MVVGGRRREPRPSKAWTGHPRSRLRGLGWATRLGKWISANENYIIDAEESGLGYFNLGRAYKVFDYLGDAWVANKGFLDSVIARGLPIYLNNSPICATGGYARELEYLFSAGVPNQGFVFVW